MGSGTGQFVRCFYFPTSGPGRRVGDLELLVTADRLDAPLGVPHKKTGTAAGHDQGEKALMLFEIGQIVIREEHLPTFPADESAHWR